MVNKYNIICHTIFPYNKPLLSYLLTITFSAYDYVVPARGKEIIKTDLQIELPSGCYGRVAPRSGLAAKNYIDVGGNITKHLFFWASHLYITYNTEVF